MENRDPSARFASLMQWLSPGLSAVAFDLDDTLFDREAAVRSLLREWLGDPPPDFVREYLRRDGRGHAPRAPLFEWLEGCCPEVGENSWGRFQKEIASHVVADPSAVPLLEVITAAGLALGLLTNGGEASQLAKLHATGLSEFFPPGQVLVSGALGLEKPHPAAFAALATALAVPPGQILFIGDHVTVDIEGAKNAGMRTCWLRRRDPGGICGDADLGIDSLAEIIPRLGRFHEL